MNKALIDEVKGRFYRLERLKLEAFLSENPEPDYPPKLKAKIEREQESWEKRKKAFERKVSDARGKYLDRVLFDNENAMLLLKDFESFNP